jgi:hypothetical protein
MKSMQLLFLVYSPPLGDPYNPENDCAWALRGLDKPAASLLKPSPCLKVVETQGQFNFSHPAKGNFTSSPEQNVHRHRSVPFSHPRAIPRSQLKERIREWINETHTPQYQTRKLEGLTSPLTLLSNTITILRLLFRCCQGIYLLSRSSRASTAYPVDTIASQIDHEVVRFENLAWPGADLLV